nr:MAG TPA: hypothetical protein [Caudoviricetes sp.]
MENSLLLITRLILMLLTISVITAVATYMLTSIIEITSKVIGSCWHGQELSTI